MTRGRGCAAPAIRPRRACGFRAARRARQGGAGGFQNIYFFSTLAVAECGSPKQLQIKITAVQKRLLQSFYYP